VVSKSVTDLSDADFDGAVARGVVLVDFWAPWCAPCRAQGSVLEEVAAEVSGQARIAKVNVDEAETVAQRYQVQAIPTLLLFKDGDIMVRLIGVQSRDTLVISIRQLLAPTVSRGSNGEDRGASELAQTQ